MEDPIEPTAAACSRRTCDGCEIEGDRVPDDVRRAFFENYPDFAKAWQESGRRPS